MWREEHVKGSRGRCTFLGSRAFLEDAEALFLPSITVRCQKKFLSASARAIHSRRAAYKAIWVIKSSRTTAFQAAFRVNKSLVRVRSIQSITSFLRKTKTKSIAALDFEGDYETNAKTLSTSSGKALFLEEISRSLARSPPITFHNEAMR